MLLLLGISAQRMWYYNFKMPFGPNNPFSYVHTSQGKMDLVAKIKRYWQKDPKAKVLIGVNAYWPLPYYLREKSKQLGYLKTKDVDAYKDEYKIIIVDKTVHWKNPGWEKKYYRLSDVQESNTYFKKLS